MSRLFFTADMHFGHANIMKYENRPFTSVEAMDNVMIQNWNNAISKHDRVIVAGDVSFYRKEKTAEIIQQLNGRKTLVKGNHDQRNTRWWMDIGFDEVSSHPIIIKEWVIVQHEPPTYINDAMPFFLIYGHVHGTDMYSTVTKTTACVCVERWEYTPVQLERIIELAKLA